MNLLVNGLSVLLCLEITVRELLTDLPECRSEREAVHDARRQQFINLLIIDIVTALIQILRCMVMFSVISLHLDNAGEPVLVKVSSYTHLAVTMKTASFAGRVLANVHVDIGSLALFGV